MPWLRDSFLTFTLVSMTGLLMACGGGGGDDTDEAESDDEAGGTNAVTMTGTWNGSFSTGVDFVLGLTQDGADLTGSYDTETGANGSLFGTVSGNSVTFTVNTEDPVSTAQFSGSVNDARTAMGGSFTIIAGGGGSGTWSATKVE